MTDQVTTFRQFLAPMTAKTYFTEYFGRQYIHMEGAAERFRDTFTWQDLNNLLRMTTIWSSKSLELAANGRPFKAEEYCYEGVSRDNEKVMRPDFDRVKQHLRDGASLTLNFAGRLTPGLRSLSQTFESVFCAPVNITIFCSWDKVQAYPAHFDTTNVFVFQIDGEKTWHIHEGRRLNAAQAPGQTTGDFSHEYHEQAKGKLLKELVMKPGDILYLPHGQYHDAIASTTASLHISLAVRNYTGYDFVNLLASHLPKDPLFREHLPPIDHIMGHDGYRKRISGRLDQILGDPKIAEELRGFLHGKAFEGIADFDLPSRGEARFYRVRWMSHGVEQTPSGKVLRGPGGGLEIPAGDEDMVAWALERDYFSNVLFAQVFSERPADQIAGMLAAWQKIGLIEAM